MAFIRRRARKPQASTPRSDIVAAGILVILAIGFTGIPILALENGVNLPKQNTPNDIGGYFLASVACVLVALWFVGRALVTGWRRRKK